jgi:hypothetical protein
VSGTNLFSSDGHVQATVGGEAAGTSCSTQSSCQVTVPALGGSPRTIPLTITTAAGTSNTVAFSYS